MSRPGDVAARRSRRKPDLTICGKIRFTWTNRHRTSTSRISNWPQARSDAPSRIETRRSPRLCSPVFLLLSLLALSASRGSECGRSAEQRHRSVSASPRCPHPRFWRLRWWLARTFKTRDYRYVENERGLPDEF